jgi:hypothetical protein
MGKQMKKNPKQLSVATRAIHGSKLYAFKGPVATPIYQTSTYRFETSEDAVRYAKGDPSVYVYQRCRSISNLRCVPLTFFLDARNERVERHEHSGKVMDVYFYRYEQYEIWGATAVMLRSFLHDLLIRGLTAKRLCKSGNS